MKVAVYFNLHKKVFSIKAMEGEKKGLVIGHSANVSIRNPVFKVSEAGRQRVLREKRKNVHAFVVGELVDYVEFDRKNDPVLDITYNPYKYSQFMIKNVENFEANSYRFGLVSMKAIDGRSSIEGV